MGEELGAPLQGALFSRGTQHRHGTEVVAHPLARLRHHTVAQLRRTQGELVVQQVHAVEQVVAHQQLPGGDSEHVGGNRRGWATGRIGQTGQGGHQGLGVVQAMFHVGQRQIGHTRLLFLGLLLYQRQAPEHHHQGQHHQGHQHGGQKLAHQQGAQTPGPAQTAQAITS